MKKNDPTPVKTSNSPKKFSELSNAELEDLYFTQNKSAPMLAKEYGLTINQVRWVLKKAGLNKDLKMRMDATQEALEAIKQKAIAEGKEEEYYAMLKKLNTDLQESLRQRREEDK